MNTAGKHKISKKNPTIWFILIVMSLSLLATETNAAVEIQQIEKELNEVQGKIQLKEKELIEIPDKILKLKKDLLFEKAMDKKLSEADSLIKLIINANSDLGKAFRFVAEAFTDGSSEEKVKKKIAEVNSKLEPYFKVDNDGNLKWGSILLWANIQTQFSSGDISALTPKTAQEILNEWKQNNQNQMEKNEQELPTLPERQKVLQTELKELQEEEEKLAKELKFLNNAKNELATLKKEMDELDRETISPLLKLKTKYEETEFIMKLHMAAVQSIEKEILGGMELFLAFRKTDIPFTDIEEAKNSTENIKIKTAELIKANSSFTNVLKVASDVTSKICGYASRLSSQPPPHADEIVAWKNESDDLIHETTGSLRNEKNDIAKIVLPLESNMKELILQIETIDAFLAKKEEIIESFEELKQIKVKLEEAEKDMKGAQESLKELIKLEEEAKSLISKNDIYGRLRNLDARINELLRNLRVKDNQLGAETTQLQGRIRAAKKKTDEARNILTPQMAEPYELGKAPRTLLELLRELNTGARPEEIFEEIVSTVSLGRKALLDAEKAAKESGRLSSVRIPEVLTKGNQCFEKIKKASEQTGGGEEKQPFTIKDLEKAMNTILPYIESLKIAKAKLIAAQGVCKNARDLRASMVEQVSKIEKAEKMVDQTLRAASEIAAKCPNVKNPENIKLLYEQAKEFTVQIGVDIVLLRKDRSSVQEKIDYSETLRGDAIMESDAAMNKINAFYKSRESIANRLSNIDDSYWNDFVRIHQSVQTKYNEIKRSSQCDVKPMDSLVDRAENSYAGALIFIGANSNLLELAEKCKSINNEQENLNGDIDAALDSCNFENAKKLIDQLQPGAKRTEFEQKYQASLRLEKRIDNLINQAHSEYKEQSYMVALSILNGALNEVGCERLKEKIRVERNKVKAKMEPSPDDPVDVEEPDDPVVKEEPDDPVVEEESDDEDIITVNWEILKLEKYCRYSSYWDKDYKESETYWALFEIPESRENIVFSAFGLEANRYFDYLIMDFKKEDRSERLRRNDPPPHEGYAKAYRSSNKKSIRVKAVTETRTEIERLRDQQWSSRDTELKKHAEKRLENLLKRIEEKMRSEGKLIDSDRNLAKGSGYDTGVPSVNIEVYERFIQDLKTGKLKINLLRNGVIVDTVKIE